MEQIIIHVDMDAFFAAVEIRDDPSLKGKPLIIGALPTERGVVATCSYEARKYGIHSAMNIKEAYRLCPHGVYMHGNYEKYKEVSRQLHEIWDSYCDASEAIALDEAYLDVTKRAETWERARRIARTIKERIREEAGLTCSVGLAYSKTAAKVASEEKKPDGYFEIPSPEDFVSLMSPRDVRALYTVGARTAEKLHAAGFHTVGDLLEQPDTVIRQMGNQGRFLVELASGQDDRKVTPYRPEDAKSISREITFQQDVEDREFLKDVLILLSFCVEHRARRYGLHGAGVTLKLTFSDMQGITRSRMTPPCDSAVEIYEEASRLLDLVELRPVRLIGAGIYHLSGEEGRQLRLDDLLEEEAAEREEARTSLLDSLQQKYRLDFAGHLEDLYKNDTLHRTVEWMRKHPS